jgi:hypothetical protein
MSCQELLKRIRMRSGRVGRKQGIEKLKKFFDGAGGKGIDRMRDDVGVNMVGQVEADGATARAAALRVVVADGRNPREIRKTHRHRDGAPLKVRRPRQRCALRRRCKCAAEQEAFRMGGPEASLDAAVCFVKGSDHITAKSHHFFIGTQGHCSLLHRIPPSRARLLGR